MLSFLVPTEYDISVCNFVCWKWENLFFLKEVGEPGIGENPRNPFKNVENFFLKKKERQAAVGRVGYCIRSTQPIKLFYGPATYGGHADCWRPGVAEAHRPQHHAGARDHGKRMRRHINIVQTRKKSLQPQFFFGRHRLFQTK